jgi:hypothetical protein
VGADFICGRSGLLAHLFGVIFHVPGSATLLLHPFSTFNNTEAKMFAALFLGGCAIGGSLFIYGADAEFKSGMEQCQKMFDDWQLEKEEKRQEELDYINSIL